MSVKAMAWAIQQRTGHPGRKLLLTALADFADDEGYCWPSRQLLAELTEMSPKSVTRYTQALRDLGLLTIERRTLDNGARSTNGFRLPLAARQMPLLPPGQSVPTPGQPVHTPGTRYVHTPRTQLSPYPLDNCDPTIEPPREPSSEPSGKKGNAPAAPFVLPDWIPAEAWEGFKAMRKSIRAPLTDHAARYTLRELERLKRGGHDPVAVLEQSVQRSWRGVFPIRQDGRESVADHNRRVAEEAKRERAARESA